VTPGGELPAAPSALPATPLEGGLFNPISEIGIVLVLVVVLVLGALGFRDRKETDVLQLVGRVARG